MAEQGRFSKQNPKEKKSFLNLLKTLLRVGLFSGITVFGVLLGFVRLEKKEDQNGLSLKFGPQSAIAMQTGRQEISNIQNNSTSKPTVKPQKQESAKGLKKKAEKTRSKFTD